ncbi:hypothetical protein APY04_3282 [Hyphomicrobium sulfonivorans]|uniref:Uncharacterized protein n=1 Tax=Hyphomicrobium sulfonivorans TaxID=121290 RepID=A0A120CTA8_HYPSL|nr:hypothetical protein APY04_3282 [Hyphomicrobium sulfonivorans]
MNAAADIHEDSRVNVLSAEMPLVMAPSRELSAQQTVSGFPESAPRRCSPLSSIGRKRGKNAIERQFRDDPNPSTGLERQ